MFPTQGTHKQTKKSLQEHSDHDSNKIAYLNYSYYSYTFSLSSFFLYINPYKNGEKFKQIDAQFDPTSPVLALSSPLPCRLYSL